MAAGRGWVPLTEGWWGAQDRAQRQDKASLYLCAGRRNKGPILAPSLDSIAKMGPENQEVSEPHSRGACDAKSSPRDWFSVGKRRQGKVLGSGPWKIPASSVVAGTLESEPKAGSEPISLDKALALPGPPCP